MDQYTGSSILEVQTRSCEYSHIFKLDKIRGALLEHIPPLDESTYSRNIGNSAVMMDGQAAQVRHHIPCLMSDSCIHQAAIRCLKSCLSKGEKATAVAELQLLLLLMSGGAACA